MRGVLIAAASTPTVTPGPSASTETPAVTEVLDRGWRLAEQVSLRPEPFGALAYHYGTRRLSFLKDPLLVAVVRHLDQHDTARTACAAAGVPTTRTNAFGRALATLADSAMIEERP